MPTIKEAVHNASVFATETLGRERTEGLRLEEVESTDVGGHEAWLITLSMVAPPQSTIGAVNAALYALAEPKRDYKIFTVLKTTGDVISMRIRELAVT